MHFRVLFVRSMPECMLSCEQEKAIGARVFLRGYAAFLFAQTRLLALAHSQ